MEVRRVPAERSDLSGDAPALPEADDPVEPSLPACLQGESPAGCAVPAELPACLQGDEPLGCVQTVDWPCAPGWETETLGAGTGWQHDVCVPAVVADCPTGLMALPGEACAAVGTDCPAADFADQATYRSMAPGHDGAIRYVKPGETGVGTESDPLGSIADALAVSSSGDIVALSAGVFVERVELDVGVALVGACASESVLAPEQTDGPAVRLTAAGAAIANLRVQGAGKGVELAAPGATLSVTGVEVLEARGAGIEVLDGHVEMRSVVVRATSPQDVGGTGGEGLVISGGTLTGQRIAAIANRGAGVLVTGGEARLTDAVLADTDGFADDGTHGQGLRVGSGASAVLDRAWVARNRSAGVEAIGSGASLQLTDAWVGDSREHTPDGSQGGGVRVTQGASASASRVVLERNRHAGIFVSGQGSTADLVDVVARDTRGTAIDGSFGNGFSVYEGAQAQLSRVVSERNRSVGIVVSGAGSSIVVADAVVRDTDGLEDSSPYAGSFGDGLVAQQKAEAKVRRAVLQGNRYSGISAMSGSRVEAGDVLVLDTLPEASTSRYGFGAMSLEKAELVLDRSVLLRSHAAGVVATGSPGVGAALTLRDCVVRDVYSDAANLDMGYGLLVEHGSQVEVDRAAFYGLRSAGVAAVFEGTDLVLRDVEVAGVERQESVPDGVVSVAGWGVRVDDGAEVSCERCLLRQFAGVGITAMASTFSGRSVLVTDPAEDHASEFAGAGVMAYQDATVALSESVIVAGRAIGLGAQGPGAVMHADDVVVRHIRPAFCFDESYGQESSCRASPKSIGNSACVVAIQGGHVQIERFDIAEARCGFGAGWLGTIHATDGRVHHTDIGLNVRDAVFDFDAVLTPSVRFFDNDTNVDSVQLQLPESPM